MIEIEQNMAARAIILLSRLGGDEYSSLGSVKRIKSLYDLIFDYCTNV